MDVRQWVRDSVLGSLLEPGEEIGAIGGADRGHLAGRAIWAGRASPTSTSPVVVVITSSRLILLEGRLDEATGGQITSARGVRWTDVEKVEAGQQGQLQHIEIGDAWHCHTLHFFEEHSSVPPSVQKDFFARARGLVTERVAAARAAGQPVHRATLQVYWTTAPDGTRTAGPTPGPVETRDEAMRKTRLRLVPVLGCLGTFLVLAGPAIIVVGLSDYTVVWVLVGFGVFALLFGLATVAFAVAAHRRLSRPA